MFLFSPLNFFLEPFVATMTSTFYQLKNSSDETVENCGNDLVFGWAGMAYEI